MEKLAPDEAFHPVEEGIVREFSQEVIGLLRLETDSGVLDAARQVGKSLSEYVEGPVSDMLTQDVTVEDLRSFMVSAENNQKVYLHIRAYNQRESEVASCFLEVERRMEDNPFANSEEVDAGVYREAIESQVRDAVFALLKKGYASFESGFLGGTAGCQFIGFAKSSTKGSIEMPEGLKMELAEHMVVAEVDAELDDRDRLILKPGRFLELGEWKAVWDEVARGLPAIEKTSNEMVGKRDFSEKQERLREGRDTTLERGYVYVDGKTKRATTEEFLEVMKRERGASTPKSLSDASGL